jgi:RimJ/RimL family protein N-acetyltransferase
VTVPAPVLRGRMVTLRPYAAGFTDAELERVFAWARDAEVLALSGGVPLDVPFEHFRQVFVGQLAQRNGPLEQHFAVLTDERRLIGRAGLFGMTAGGRAAELGIVIGERDCWGRGYGRDAAGALVDFAFARLGLDRVVLFAFPDNARARRAFAAVGFETVREVGRFSFTCGHHRVVEMVLTPESRRRARLGLSAPVNAPVGAPAPGMAAERCRSA